MAWTYLLIAAVFEVGWAIGWRVLCLALIVGGVVGLKFTAS